MSARTLLLILLAAVLGSTIAAVYNSFHPAMPWSAFNVQADAIDLHNVLTVCERNGDEFACLTYQADMKTTCTQDACGPITEIE